MSKTEITKISPEVMKAGQKNKLKIKQIKFVDNYIKDNNASKAYKEAYNKEDSKNAVVRSGGCENLTKPNIAKTILEVLKDNKITKNSTIIRHNNIIDKAIKINQLSTAEKGNSRFMEMLGMLEKRTETSNNVYINAGKVDLLAINKLIDSK